MSWMAIEELGGDLVAPPPGKQQFPRDHDKTYGEISDGFDSVRDTCNSGIDKVNGWIAQAGIAVELPKLPEESLDDYVVFPLAGNYYRIQQNAAACDILNQGMRRWSQNFVKLGGNSVLAFEGRAQVSFGAHLGAYSAVMAGIGGVVDAGSVVFDSIAKVSEKIAIQVEKALIEMGKRLIKLAKHVSKRFLGGWVSAALLVKDLAEKGLGVITDVIDELRWCIEAIDKCFALKAEIEAWAQTQADRLAAFKDVAKQISALPSVLTGTPLTDVESPDLSSVEDALAGIKPDFSETDEGAAAQKEVEDASTSVTGDSGYVHPSWAENCATPPPGRAHLPYIPDVEPVSPGHGTGDSKPWLKYMTPDGKFPEPHGPVLNEQYEAYDAWVEAGRPGRKG